MVNVKEISVKTERNYQLDFLKLLCTLFVFISHTYRFIGENTRFSIPLGLGWWSVHLFFIISGLLMVNSYMKKPQSTDYGKTAMRFVIGKFKGLAIEYWVAFSIGFVVFLILYKLNVFESLVKSIPEILAIELSGLCGTDLSMINGQTWYISAMLICMLPLYYMLQKNKDFFLYVFSPLTALILLGYMYCEESHWLTWYNTYSFLTGGIIRGICGLCFGVVCWTIAEKILSCKHTDSQRWFFTVVEILLYLLIFAICFYPQNNYSMIYCAMLIMPVPIAITFSGVSYVGKLFRFSWMKWLSSISLAIYLNHIAEKCIVQSLFTDKSYKFCTLLMFVFTICLCVVYYLLIWVIKNLWNKKIKSFFIAE